MNKMFSGKKCTFFVTLIFFCLFYTVNVVQPGYGTGVKKDLLADPLFENFNIGSKTQPITTPAPGEGMTIVLQPNDPLILINDVKIQLDPGKTTTPIIYRNRTMIPISLVANILGGSAEWIEEKKHVIVELNNNIIEFAIGSKAVVVNGNSKPIDVPAMLVNGRTLVPIRYVAENANVSIQWKNRKVYIIANYVPEGMQKIRNLFSGINTLENSSKIPGIISILTRTY